MSEQKNIFESILDATVEKWKETYVEDFNEIYDRDQEYIDDWRALKAVQAYRLGLCDVETFANEIMRIYTGWDLLMRSIKYSQVESKIQCFIPNFWEEGCGKNESSWRDYAPISLNKYE